MIGIPQVPMRPGAWPAGRGSNLVKFPGGAKEKTVKMPINR